MLAGGCMCGSVRFEVDEPLGPAGYCHCTRCRRRSGTIGSVQARILPGSLRVVAGEELIRAYAPETGFPKSFCSVCGSALWSVNPATGEVAAIRLGAFDGDPVVRPSYRQFTAFVADFEPLPDDGLPRYPERRPPDIG